MKFLNHNLFTGDITVSGTTTLSTATGVTRATGDNSTHLATTAFVKNQGYATTAALAGYVPVTRTITINGVTLDLSADRTWTIAAAGTVTTVYETVKNASGATILKGTPLAVVPGQTSGNVSDVVPADASDPTKMPAVFIANENIADEAEGEAVLFGYFSGVDTSLYQSGTTVYVAPGGGWTATKPVYPNKIQNLGVITKQHATNGAGIVTGVGRANDLPNLTAGKIWVGTANYPIESTTVHIDEANTRMGVGTSSIEGGLHINYSAANTLLMQRISPDSGPPEAIGRKARGTVSAKTGVLSGDRLWFFAAAGYYGTEGIDGAWSANKVGMNFVASETWTPSAQGTHITWATTAVGQTTRTDKMILTGTGDLGIGTTSPSSKLHVVGPINIERTGVANVYSTIDMEGNFRFNASGGYAHTFLNNGSELVRIMPSGNVGIGTTSPAGHMLDIASIAGSTNNSAIRALYPTGGGLLNTEFGALANRGGAWTAVYGKQGAASSAAYFDGNVGIGTASPTATLDVAGEIAIRGGESADDARMYFRASDNSNRFTIETDLDGTTNNDLLGFRSASTDNILVLKGNGNVGIGTTSPAVKLDVVGNISASGTNPKYYVTRGDGTYVPILQLESSTDDIIIGATSIDAVRFVDDSGEVMRLDGAGNVGIGTTSPSQKLHVVGNAYISNSIVVGSSGGNHNVSFVRNDGSAVGAIGWHSSGYYYVGGHPDFGPTAGNDVRFYGFGSSLHLGSSLAGDVLTVTTGAKIGIGTTNPTNKLQVANGDMSITSGYSFILADTDTNWRIGRNIISETGNQLTANTMQFVAANAANEGWQFINDDGFTVLEIGGLTSSRNVWITAGNLSVGVASPSEKIHVAGNIRIDGSSTAAILETGDKTAGEGGVVFESYDVATTYGAFVDYVIYDTTRDNMRTGTLRAVWNTGQAVYTDVSTVDIGDTTNVVLYADIDGTNVNLIVNGPTSFTIKYNLKLIK